jgi:tetratricopeptide (TPR) repeat protein
MNRDKLVRWAGALLVLLLVNTAYIAAFASPTIFYMGNVVLHLALGVVLAVLLLWFLRRMPLAGACFLAAAALGIFLAVRGNTMPHRWALIAHIVVAAAALAAFLPYALRRTGAGFRQAYVACLVLLAVFPASTALYRKVHPNPNDRIRNPMIVPASMNEEGGGPKSPFFPSSAKTNVGGIIPANFFMDSEACGRCHKDIYEQWKSSMHHFASFNNQFYRKAIEYMQSVVGPQPSKWCAGCHDHAVFFNGRFDRPIKDQIDTPEAHAGLSCTSCHAIVHVDSSMGNGSYTIQYPPLHQLLSSKNKFIQAADYFMTYLNPAPHRRTFMKPFMREDVAEYCSVCHKVHLDVPVNQYRWFRGFNEYDNWQASGVSGEGARSFYYPAKSMNCADCHMPLVPSNDPGNIGGQVHSHRFPGANTAVPYANQDQAQLETTEKFLRSGFVTVDIFAVSPVKDTGTAMLRRTGEGPQTMTAFAVGEEAEQTSTAVIREVGQVAAPIDRSGIHLQPGSTARVDVVVRTRTVGHFFPGGTVDAQDVWLELEGKDAAGRVIFWSGCVEDGGKGPVEPGAHFYRSYQLDGEGNPINKRNAWQARSVLYVRLIPPGAADVAHYRVRIPKDAKSPLTFTARLNYRKFSRYYTEFAYAGQPKPNQDPKLLTAAYNGLEYSFDPRNIPRNVSGNIKGRIPDLPIVTLATSTVSVPLGEPVWTPVVRKEDRERWNDWGIGLLLQGDLKGAEYAFKKVTEAEPGYADGWLNVARALIQEGETDAAKPYVRKALEIDPKLGRIYFFKAMIEKADGRYDEALKSLETTLAMYPRDRVALNQAARILFLQRKYAEALQYLDRVCLVDPEDLQMHYTRMLCYRGLRDAAGAEREQILFKRFKAEESAQAITAKARMNSPEDNNERQQVHDHESVPLPLAAPRPAQVLSAAGGTQ